MVLEVERLAARFFGCEAAFYFGSGYAGPRALVKLVEADVDAVFADEASHYSVLPGRRGRRPAVRAGDGGAGYVRVPWDAVDAWYEEGRKLVDYPPNPYHRVDCRPTKRHLEVEVAGVSLVDTDDTLILFETSLAPKLYVERGLVRTDLLRRTETMTYCNYKGESTYWSAVVGDTVVEDVAWSYEDPLPESLPIKGYLSFDSKKVDVVTELPELRVVPVDRGVRS